MKKKKKRPISTKKQSSDQSSSSPVTSYEAEFVEVVDQGKFDEHPL